MLNKSIPYKWIGVTIYWPVMSVYYSLKYKAFLVTKSPLEDGGPLTNSAVPVDLCSGSVLFLPVLLPGRLAFYFLIISPVLVRSPASVKSPLMSKQTKGKRKKKVREAVCSINTTIPLWFFVFTGYKLAFNYLKAKKYVDAIDICHQVTLHIS